MLAVMNQVSDDYPLDDPKDYSIEGPKVDGPVDEDPRDYSREDSRDYSMEDYSMEDPRDYSIEDTRSDDETEQSLKEKVMAYVCEIAPELPACQGKSIICAYACGERMCMHVVSECACGECMCM